MTMNKRSRNLPGKSYYFKRQWRHTHMHSHNQSILPSLHAGVHWLYLLSLASPKLSSFLATSLLSGLVPIRWPWTGTTSSMQNSEMSYECSLLWCLHRLLLGSVGLWVQTMPSPRSLQRGFSRFWKESQILMGTLMKEPNWWEQPVLFSEFIKEIGCLWSHIAVYSYSFVHLI